MKYIKTIEQFINESADDLVPEPTGNDLVDDEPKTVYQNYMLFQNLKQIKEQIDKLLSMDLKKMDELISDGHDWAADHITTSKDDIDEVYHFIKSHINKESEITDSKEH